MILFMFLILGLKLTVKTWFVYGWLADENWSLTTQIDSLVQHCIISIVLATGMLQSLTELCIWADDYDYGVVLSKITWCFVLYLKKNYLDLRQVKFLSQRQQVDWCDIYSVFWSFYFYSYL